MSHPRLSFGCANVGVSWTCKEDLDALATALTDAGIRHLDTAARYPPHSPGLAERLLGEHDFAGNGFSIDTKIMVKAWDGAGSMAKDAIAQSLSNSLGALKTQKVCPYMRILSHG
jgi:aflatoxin B1 aldehyde reductase